MIKFTLGLILSLLTLKVSADEFKLKIQMATVDHQSSQGAMVTAIERGEVSASEKMGDDGEVKLKLETGRVYEIWIQKQGYVPHVIHNVHSNGVGKFKITLYKSDESYPDGIPPYHLAHRTFDDVKQLTTPVDMANDHVHLIMKESLTNDESKALDKILEMAKSQEKAQKKIDKLYKERSKTDKALADVSKEISEGKIEREDGEKEKAKLQKKLNNIAEELKKLAY